MGLCCILPNIVNNDKLYGISCPKGSDIIVNKEKKRKIMYRKYYQSGFSLLD